MRRMKRGFNASSVCFGRFGSIGLGDGVYIDVWMIREQLLLSYCL